MTNCPNCGAPIVGPKCEYCDTVFKKSGQPTIGLELGYEGARDLFLSYKNTGGNGMYFQAIADGVRDGIFTPNQARELIGYPRI